jgi:hypothetical protein
MVSPLTIVGLTQVPNLDWSPMLTTVSMFMEISPSTLIDLFLIFLFSLSERLETTGQRRALTQLGHVRVICAV